MRSLLPAIVISCLSLIAATGAERTWTGGGTASSPSWELAINWATGAPLTGDSLIFPAVSSGTNKTASNTFTGETFGPLTIDGSGYVLTGNTLALTGGIFLNGSNTAQVTLPMTISAPTAFDISSGGGTLTIGQPISGAGAVIKSGAGTLVFTGTPGHTGGTIIDNGVLRIESNLTGEVQIRRGFLIGSGSVDGVRSLHQGVLDAVGISPGTNSAAGTLTVDGDVTLFNEDLLHFSLASTTSDKLVVNGAVDLDGCAFQFGLLSTPALNTDIVVIDNDGTDAVIYDAANPSNYLFNVTVGGMPFQFRTVGGTNRNDVVVRRVASNSFTMTLDSDDADDQINHGSSITFTAQVMGAVTGTPFSTTPGSVSFWDGNEYLDTRSINGFQVQYTTTTLKPGLRKITAMFEGNGSNAPVRSSVYTVYVQGTQTITTLAASPAGSSDPGELVTLTASVSASPSGTVTFFDNGSEIGSAAVISGQAVITTSTMLAGDHDLHATFVPTVGTAFTASTTAVALDHDVDGTPTTTALTSSAPSVVAGTTVTFTATVTGANAGSVQFRDGAAVLGTSAVNGGGVATLAVSGLAAGTHSITARYLGTINFETSTSSVFSQVITAHPDGSGGGPVELEESSGCGLGGGVATLVLGLLMLVGLRLRRD